ncbi:hypothetical protein [Mycoplasmopsis californica]|uniref:hypothetical protein n=1 Tax=Mycoplasmopsis californica TaxID=2113 RepID=UPI0006913385|nr:hypothetical protein [Mycoplasmopsis californica]
MDVSSSKTKKQPVITKKIEVEEEIKRQTPVVKTMSISVDDLNTEVKEISVYITDKEQKLLSEVTLDDVQATSKFNFVATSLRREEDAVVVTYLLRDGNRESKELTTVIKGFKKESSENMPLHYIYHVPRVGWTWAAFLTLGIVCLIAIICIILLSLYMNGLFTLYWK